MMLSLRSKLFKQLECANDAELGSLKHDFETISNDWTSLKEEFESSLKERIAWRDMVEKVRNAKATYPEDQKFIDTIEIKKCKLFEYDIECDCCRDGCPACSDREYEERLEFDQELVFEFGYSVDDIRHAIPDFFEGEIPTEIAEFASTRLKINMDDYSVTYDNGISNVRVESFGGETDDYPSREKKTEVISTFPILGMMVDLCQIIYDIGLGEFIYDSKNDEYLPDCLVSIAWNWEERFLKLNNIELEWKVEAVKLAVDALNGVANFTPCEEFVDSREYMLNFVQEELKYQEMLKEMENDGKVWYYAYIADGGLIQREKVEEARRAKRRKLA